MRERAVIARGKAETFGLAMFIVWRFIFVFSGRMPRFFGAVDRFQWRLVTLFRCYCLFVFRSDLVVFLLETGSGKPELFLFKPWNHFIFADLDVEEWLGGGLVWR